MLRTARVISSESHPCWINAGVELYELTIHEALRSLRSGETSAVDLTEAYLRRIEQQDPRVQAYLRVTADRAREDARRADERRKQGDDAPLLGIPIALKDIF